MLNSRFGLLLPLLLGVMLSPAEATSGAVHSPASYPGPANVAVVANADSAASLRIALRYKFVRRLPPENICALPLPTEYTITLETFEEVLRAPLAECLVSRGIEERVLFLVPTWDVPAVLRLPNGEVRALDSFLTDLRHELPAAHNPYHRKTDSFLRENGYRGYLVTRLDGPTAESAAALVDRAAMAELQDGMTSGIGYFDLEPNGLNPLHEIVISGAGHIGNRQIRDAHDIVAAAGWPTVLDEHDEEFGTPPALAFCPTARFYLGWYSLYNYNDAFEWLPGAVGVHIDSFSALNYRHPSHGAWTAGAIWRGITATAGAVAEPTIQGFIEGDVLFEAFVADGVSWAEAAYRAIPRHQWMMVVFGDPLLSLTRRYPGTRLPPPDFLGPAKEAIEHGAHHEAPSQRSREAASSVRSKEAAAAIPRESPPGLSPVFAGDIEEPLDTYPGDAREMPPARSGSSNCAHGSAPERPVAPLPWLLILLAVAAAKCRCALRAGARD